VSCKRLAYFLYKVGWGYPLCEEDAIVWVPNDPVWECGFIEAYDTGL